MEGIIFGQYVRGVVSGYPTELRNGGGKVVVSAAGAIALTPASTQVITASFSGVVNAPSLTTQQFALFDESSSARTILQSGRNRFDFLNAAASGFASLYTGAVTLRGTAGQLVAEGTGTHTFSGPVKVTNAGNTISPAFFADITDDATTTILQAKRSAAKRFSVNILTSTQDVVFYTQTGASGSEASTESFRLLNASGYGKVASRWGIGVDPSYPLHVASAVSGWGIVTTAGGIQATSGTTNGDVAVRGVAGAAGAYAGYFSGVASATAPVVVIKLGATPGAGGDAVQVQNSDGTINHFVINGTGTMEVRRSASDALVKLFDSGGSEMGRIEHSTGAPSALVYYSQGVLGLTAGRSGSGAEVRIGGAYSNNLALFATGSFGGGVNVTFIANANTVPTTNPSGGGILYAEGGALKWRGSAGTVTTLAAA